jgi:hypothetical protein
MNPEPSKSGLPRPIQDAHLRADVKEEVLKFLVHVAGACGVCRQISSSHIDHLSNFLADSVSPVICTITINIDIKGTMLMYIIEAKTVTYQQCQK